MFKSQRAITALACAFFLFLLTPAWSLAQPPEPAVPDTTPGPATLPAPPATAPAPGYGGAGGPAEAVKALELLRFESMVKGDTGTLERVLGEDLTYTHSTGAVDSKAHFLDILKS